ncbi:MAG: tRNA pseudouridine(55) synthase TruB [Trueperaceae bacterium]
MTVYPVDKPLGLTSHDVVAQARRRLGTRRVGHAGTLDPLATGVLTLLVNESTKLSPYLTAGHKRYLAWVALGAGTPTLDAEGPVTEVAEPQATSRLYQERIEVASAEFENVTLQRPPAFSAVKQQGQRSYAAARRGELDEPPERPVSYLSVRLLAFARSREALPHRFARTPAGWRADPAGREFDLPPTLLDLPTALFALEVGAGTYVRSFARDLGAALGVPAHLAGLVRTGAGNVDLTDCTPLEELGAHPGMAPLDALSQPRLQVDGATASAVRQGKKLTLPIVETTVLHEADGALVAMVEPRAPEATTPPAAGEAPDASTGTVRPVRVLRAWQR